MVIKKSLVVDSKQMELVFSTSPCLPAIIVAIGSFKAPLGQTTIHSVYMYFIVMWVKYPGVSRDGTLLLSHASERENRHRHTAGQLAN